MKGLCIWSGRQPVHGLKGKTGPLHIQRKLKDPNMPSPLPALSFRCGQGGFKQIVEESLPACTDFCASLFCCCFARSWCCCCRRSPRLTPFTFQGRHQPLLCRRGFICIHQPVRLTVAPDVHGDCSLREAERCTCSV